MLKKIKSTFQKSIRTKRKIAQWLAYIRAIKPVASYEKLETPLAPDYQNLKNWAAHPAINDKSKFTPDGLAPNPTPGADVFFIHPTTFFGNQSWNDPIKQGSSSQTFIEEAIITEQASVFNGACRIFAPRYRQATFYSFLENNKNSHRALELAFEDIKQSFAYYLENENNGRPFFIAGHSQGSLHGIRLLEESVENTACINNFVAAYLLGFRFPVDKFNQSLFKIKPAKSANDIKCVIAYDTYLESGRPGHRLDFATHWYNGKWERRAWKKVLTINPANWSQEQNQPAFSQGAAHVTFNKNSQPNIKAFLSGQGKKASAIGLSDFYKNEVKAWIKEDGFLYVTSPKHRIFKKWLLPKGNLHFYDYSLFYKNLRDNIIQRLSSYENQQ